MSCIAHLMARFEKLGLIFNNYLEYLEDAIEFALLRRGNFLILLRSS